MIARRHALYLRQFRVPDGQPKRSPPRSVRGKAVGVISLTTLAFALSWAVYYVVLLHREFSNVHLPEWVEFIAVWLGLTNSWWNVFIYSIMNRNFRNHLKSVLLRFCPRLRQQGGMEIAEMSSNELPAPQPPSNKTITVFGNDTTKSSQVKSYSGS